MRRLRLLALLLLTLAPAPTLKAADVYFAQNAAGGNTGADCADAHALSTSAIFQVPGNVLHECGVYTGALAATGYSIVANGTVGNPITFKMEPGASFTSPAWANAIVGTNVANIVLDGGINGLIINTANGTNLANSNTGTTGISLSGTVTNVEIKNWTCSNLYIHVAPTTSNPGGGQCIAVTGTVTNLSIHDSTLHDSQHNLIIQYTGTSSGIDIYNIHSYNTVWGIFVGDNNGGASVTNVYVHGSDVHDFANWFDTDFHFNHYDGIFFQNTNTIPSSSHFTNSAIYNNYLHGTMDANGTGYIYVTDSAHGTSNIDIFNNDCSHTSLANSGTPEACIVIGFSSHIRNLVNNTLIGNGSTSPQNALRIRDTGGVVALMQNNVIPNAGTAIDLYAGNSITAANYNVYGLPSSYFFNPPCSCNWMFAHPDGNFLFTLAAWVASTGVDTPNSQSVNPMLATNNVPLIGSPVVTSGTNLTAIASGQPVPGLGALQNDKPLTVGVGAPLLGNPRPTTGTVWQGGAYQLTAQVTLTPSPLAFGPQVQSTTSATKLATFAVSGISDTLNTPYASITGPNALDFAINGAATTCSNNLVVSSGSHCIVGIVFTPSTLTNETATLTVSGTVSAIIPLTGSGVPAQPSPGPAPALFVNYPASRTIDVTVSNCLNPCKVQVTCVSGCNANAALAAKVN